MRRDHRFSYALTSGLHRLAADRSRHCRIHHQLSESPRRDIQPLDRLADYSVIVSIHRGLQLRLGIADLRDLVSTQLPPRRMTAALLHGRENRLSLVLRLDHLPRADILL